MGAAALARRPRRYCAHVPEIPKVGLRTGNEEQVVEPGAVPLTLGIAGIQDLRGRGLPSLRRRAQESSDDMASLAPERFHPGHSPAPDLVLALRVPPKLFDSNNIGKFPIR